MCVLAASFASCRVRSPRRSVGRTGWTGGRWAREPFPDVAAERMGPSVGADRTPLRACIGREEPTATGARSGAATCQLPGATVEHQRPVRGSDPAQRLLGAQSRATSAVRAGRRSEGERESGVVPLEMQGVTRAGLDAHAAAGAPVGREGRGVCRHGSQRGRDVVAASCPEPTKGRPDPAPLACGRVRQWRRPGQAEGQQPPAGQWQPLQVVDVASPSSTCRVAAGQGRRLWAGGQQPCGLGHRRADPFTLWASVRTHAQRGHAAGGDLEIGANREPGGASRQPNDSLHRGAAACRLVVAADELHGRRVRLLDDPPQQRRQVVARHCRRRKDLDRRGGHAKRFPTWASRPRPSAPNPR